MERRPQDTFSGSSLYAITPAGQALRRVGEVLQKWLDESSDGPIELGTTAAKSTIGALVEGWSTNIVRALAAKPLSLTDLNRLIPKVSYPSLERRLGGMRLVNLVEPHPVEGRGTPYRTTSWLRRAVMPLTAAAGWEHKYLPDATPPIGRLDVEAVFLLAVPLMVLPESLAGKCRLTAEVQGGPSPTFAGVLVCIEEGKVASCSVQLEGKADGWASGTPLAWLRRMNGAANGLEMGGDLGLVIAVADALQASATVRV